MMDHSFDAIYTQRTKLRPITESDVGARYLGWFSDAEAVRFIESARSPQSIESLRAFVRDRADRPDIWFLGIFCRDDGGLIGTIKVEPIDTESGVAVMGILIGEAKWRGIGLAGEVIAAVARELDARLGIRHLDLGVHPDNARAFRAYERIGFRTQSANPRAIRMRLSTEGSADAAP
jgi:RimJ/RimL family protein N-acetyltransferase